MSIIESNQHTEVSRRVPSKLAGTVRQGDEMCKVINFIQQNTYMRFWLNVGEIYHKVVWVKPFFREIILIYLEGCPQPIHARFDVTFRMTAGDTFSEFNAAIRNGGYFPTEQLHQVI